MDDVGTVSKCVTLLFPTEARATRHVSTSRCMSRPGTDGPPTCAVRGERVTPAATPKEAPGSQTREQSAQTRKQETEKNHVVHPRQRKKY